MNVGAILAGFCGTFLAIKIQREASYHREPGGDNKTSLSHFTASLLVLVLATVWTSVFGVVLPLSVLGGSRMSISPGLVTGGVFGGLVLLATYFVLELIHYKVFKIIEKDGKDQKAWKQETPYVVIGFLFAATCVWYFL